MFEQLLIEYVKAVEAVNVITDNITIRFIWSHLQRQIDSIAVIKPKRIFG
jgi:hypothetical protein